MDLGSHFPAGCTGRFAFTRFDKHTMRFVEDRIGESRSAIYFIEMVVSEIERFPA
ncbi:hypothetical protein [Herbidospora sp. RD11066]